MILVVGGTGHLGRRVVTSLLADGERVRVMAKGAAAASDLGDQGANLFPADVRDPHAVRAAMTGVDVCVSAMQGLTGEGGANPASVDRDGNRNLVDAAAAAGAEIVMLSVVGASANHPIELHRMKWAAEEYLRHSSVPWTIVRGNAFAETWADLLRGSADSAGRVRVFGRGQNPINFVSVADVATAVVRAVRDPSLRGQVIEVGGPENLTFNQFALRVTAGREPRHVPRTALRVVAALAGPVKPQLARLARAAVVMDTADLTFDPSRSLAAYPWLPCTPVSPIGVG